MINNVKCEIKWIDYDCELINPPEEVTAMKHLELCGRNCYNSYDKMTDESYKVFIGNLIKNNHTSVLEHITVTAKLTMDRGLSHEWVRHRVGSAYSQQSTRYCKYDTPECIMPTFIKNTEDSSIRYEFIAGVQSACDTYKALIEKNISPQVARGVLPNCLSTVLYATHNFREWREIFKQRYFNKGAHPDFRVLMDKVYKIMKTKYPIIFPDAPIEVL